MNRERESDNSSRASKKQRTHGGSDDVDERDEFKNEIQELESRIQTKDMTEEAKSKLRRELRKLKMMSPMSAEATVVRNYIDWVLALPWFDKSDFGILRWGLIIFCDAVNLHGSGQLLGR